MNNIDNSVVSHLNPEEYLYLTSWWCKRYDDDHRGKSNTVRLTGKPADTEGKRNPGVEQSQISVPSTSSGSQKGGRRCHTR